VSGQLQAPAALPPRGKSPCTHGKGGWVGHTACLYRRCGVETNLLPLPAPILGHTNLHLSNHIYSAYILIRSSYPRLGLSNGLFPSAFPTNTLYARLMRATYPGHPILHDLIILLTFSVEHELQNSSLCSLIQGNQVDGGLA
jgi:hypothetical protein